MSTEKIQYRGVQKFDVEEKSKGGGKGFLYLAACIANLTAFTCGLSFGWTSPITPKLLSNSENTLPTGITEDQATWIGSLLPVGAAIGPFLAGYVVDKLGRKNTLLLSTLPIICAFFMSAFAGSVSIFYTARFLCGISTGGIFTVLPMYIGEISTDEVRGALGTFMQLFIVVGLFCSFCIGPYVTIANFNLMCTLVPIAFLFIFYAFIPETPHYFISKGEINKARLSLAKLRSSTTDEVQDELTLIKTSVDESMANKGNFMDIFKSKGLTRAFIISVGLVSIQQLSGINVILFYAQGIFAATGSSMDPEISSIIIGVVQVLASIVVAFIVERFGKRPLLLSSALLMGLSLGALGIYFYLKDSGSDVGSLGWLPITSLIVYIIFYCFGFGPLPWAVMGELFPSDVKSAASTFTASGCWLEAFIITKSYNFVLGMIGNAGCFFVFAGFCIAAIFFVLKLVPETSGKSFKEIQNILNGKK